jgi:epoxide hydrolase-like predicted phosphatase
MLVRPVLVRLSLCQLDVDTRGTVIARCAAFGLLPGLKESQNIRKIAIEDCHRGGAVTIRAVVFDIGGILEVVAEGGDPTRRFPDMIARWERRLGLPAGELDARITKMDERLSAAGKDGSIGSCTEEEWLAELGLATGMNQAQIGAFMCDFWDVYCGEPNSELIAYFQGLRPRYQTALLSNSFVGARREEEARFGFAAMTDLIVYSHEEGISKPDPRIYERAWRRLDVQPHEMIFLDDVEPNILAARDCGIHAILFHDNAQAIAEIETCLQDQSA